ncbi:MAG: hypothetical protein QOI09_30, partial [Chloroflexota bacterium]|nr:hypothetical protein [Chloroflexota bacterium]
TIGTFFTPARGALLPRIVPREGLLTANSLTQATRVVAFVTGAGLAGLIVGLAGQFWPAFVLDSASFVASFVLIARLPATIGRIPVEARAAAAGVGEALLVGLRTIARSRTLSTTIAVLAVVMLGGGAVNVLFVPVIVRVLNAGPVWLGPVELAQGASMILATGLIGSLGRRFRSSTIVTVGVAAMAVAVASIGAITEIWQLLVLSFALGWFLSPVQAAVVTIMQQGTPDEELGRVMAVLQAAMSATSVLSMGFAGIAGDAIGIREVFFVAGAIVAGGFALAVIGYRGRAAEPMPRAPGGQTANVG